MNRILASAVLAGAALVASSGVAFAGEVPPNGGPAAEKQNCMDLVKLALPLDPPSTVKGVVCQDKK